MCFPEVYCIFVLAGIGSYIYGWVYGIQNYESSGVLVLYLVNLAAGALGLMWVSYNEDLDADADAREGLETDNKGVAGAQLCGCAAFNTMFIGLALSAGAGAGAVGDDRYRLAAVVMSTLFAASIWVVLFTYAVIMYRDPATDEELRFKGIVLGVLAWFAPQVYGLVWGIQHLSTGPGFLVTFLMTLGICGVPALVYFFGVLPQRRKVFSLNVGDMEDVSPSAWASLLAIAGITIPFFVFAFTTCSCNRGDDHPLLRLCLSDLLDDDYRLAVAILASLVGAPVTFMLFANLLSLFNASLPDVWGCELETHQNYVLAFYLLAWFPQLYGLIWGIQHFSTGPGFLVTFMMTLGICGVPAMAYFFTRGPVRMDPEAGLVGIHAPVRQWVKVFSLDADAMEDVSPSVWASLAFVSGISTAFFVCAFVSYTPFIAGDSYRLAVAVVASLVGVPANFMLAANLLTLCVSFMMNKNGERKLESHENYKVAATTLAWYSLQTYAWFYGITNCHSSVGLLTLCLACNGTFTIPLMCGSLWFGRNHIPGNFEDFSLERISDTPKSIWASFALSTVSNTPFYVLAFPVQDSFQTWTAGVSGTCAGIPLLLLAAIGILMIHDKCCIPRQLEGPLHSPSVLPEPSPRQIDDRPVAVDVSPAICPSLPPHSSNLAESKCRTFQSIRDEGVPTCVVCLDPACVAVLPCGHRILCVACAQQSANLPNVCPICRVPITGTQGERKMRHRRASSFKAYGAFLEGMMADGKVTRAGRERLDKYRAEHGITGEQHAQALQGLGLSERGFEAKQEKKKLCVICYDEPCTHLVVPCGHQVLCGDCCGMVQICPLCRKPVQTVVRVFN